MKVVITGANGFIGSRLAHVLKNNSKLYVSLITRRALSSPKTENFVINDINSSTDWSTILKNKTVVIHTAAKANLMKESKNYLKENVDGTLNLARQAANAGVKRFIFISSIKVNGEQTDLGKSFKVDDLPAPKNVYGISKLETEKGLQQLSSETGMELVIIRPPLVYGYGVKGNFAKMIMFINSGIPLPLGDTFNERSLVALDNLIDLIVTCIDHPKAANETFLVADGDDFSTTELLVKLAKVMDKPARLISIPPWFLMFIAIILGKKNLAQRLLGSLKIDISKTRELLGWSPPISVDEGLHRCFDDQIKHL